MGFDLFLATVSIVAAAVATWALLRLFPSSDAQRTISLRADGGFGADSPNAADGEPTANGKVTADVDESTADVDGQSANHPANHPANHLGKRLAIALILTIPTFVITLLALAKIAMPGWLTNPWLHAIVATPVMFYCAAPMHNHGTAALKSRTPNADSLLSLAMTIVYVYSLLACVVSWIFPAGSRNQYFAFASMVAVLSLAISLIEQRPMARKASEGDIPTAQSQEKQEIQEKQETQQSMDTLIQASITCEIRTRVMQITATVTVVIAVWTFALWLIFGLQPKLAIAVLIGATVLAVAGLVLQAYDRQPSR